MVILFSNNEIVVIKTQLILKSANKFNDSKIFFCGDFSQTDLTKTNERNGLHDFLRILENMDDFACIEFDIPDIVRSGFVRNYLIEKTKLGIGVDL